MRRSVRRWNPFHAGLAMTFVGFVLPGVTAPLHAQAVDRLALLREHQAAARAAMARGDTEGARVAFDSVLALAPRHAPTLYEMAALEVGAERPERALEILHGLAVAGLWVVRDVTGDERFDSLQRTPGMERILRIAERTTRPIVRSDTAFVVLERDLMPEGTAWDSVSGVLFLGSLRAGRILAIEPDGGQRAFVSEAWGALGTIAGIEVDAERRLLWATSNPGVEGGPAEHGFHGLVALRIPDEAVERRIPLSPEWEGAFLNDLTVLPDGAVFVTDTGRGAVYRLSPGAVRLEEAVPAGSLVAPNGITHDTGGSVLWVSELTAVRRLDAATGELSFVRAPSHVSMSGVDGLAFHRGALIAQQPRTTGRVVRWILDGSGEAIVGEEILDAHRPDFDLPTTGEVAGDDYLYIANSQVGAYPPGSPVGADTLQPVVVLRARLPAGEVVPSSSKHVRLRASKLPRPLPWTSHTSWTSSLACRPERPRPSFPASPPSPLPPDRGVPCLARLAGAPP